jgi:hypothetical protein
MGSWDNELMSFDCEAAYHHLFRVESQHWRVSTVPEVSNL